MKKILFVNLSLYNGGAEKSLVNLLNELPRDKYEIDLMLFKKEGLFLNQVPDNINVIDAPKALKKIYLPVFKGGVYSLVKIVSTILSKRLTKTSSEAAAYRWIHFYKKFVPQFKKEYDVALAYISGEVCYFVVDKIVAKKKIVWVHNDYINAEHPADFDRPYFSCVDDIVTISDECLTILKEVFPEYAGKCSFIPNITSSSIIRSRATEFYPEEYKLDVPIILSVGRLSTQKGFDWAIEAASLLKERSIKFKWIVIGDGGLKNELLQLVENYQLQGYFELIGTRENPYPYMKNCDIIAQTSRFEGKSVVIDEAKILCKPILVTNYATAKDQIIPNEEGIVCEMNPVAIADSLEELILNSKLREILTAKLSNNDYGNAQVVSQYIDLIEK